jgi:hypothetical protein
MRSSTGRENASYWRLLIAERFGLSSPCDAGPGASSDETFVSRKSYITSRAVRKRLFFGPGGEARNRGRLFDGEGGVGTPTSLRFYYAL